MTKTETSLKAGFPFFCILNVRPKDRRLTRSVVSPYDNNAGERSSPLRKRSLVYDKTEVFNTVGTGVPDCPKRMTAGGETSPLR